MFKWMRKAWWAHAFAVENPAGDFTPQERELVERLARFVAQRRLSGPALVILESGRPLNFVGSQVLAFLAPFLTVIFSPVEYELFVRLLEKRRSVDLIVEAIVERENERHG